MFGQGSSSLKKKEFQVNPSPGLFQQIPKTISDEQKGGVIIKSEGSSKYPQHSKKNQPACYDSDWDQQQDQDDMKQESYPLSQSAVFSSTVQAGNYGDSSKSNNLFNSTTKQKITEAPCPGILFKNAFKFPCENGLFKKDSYAKNKFQNIQTNLFDVNTALKLTQEKEFFAGIFSNDSTVISTKNQTSAQNKPNFTSNTNQINQQSGLKNPFQKILNQQSKPLIFGTQSQVIGGNIEEPSKKMSISTNQLLPSSSIFNNSLNQINSKSNQNTNLNYTSQISFTNSDVKTPTQSMKTSTKNASDTSKNVLFEKQLIKEQVKSSIVDSYKGTEKQAQIFEKKDQQKLLRKSKKARNKKPSIKEEEYENPETTEMTKLKKRVVELEDQNAKYLQIISNLSEAMKNMNLSKINVENTNQKPFKFAENEETAKNIQFIKSQNIFDEDYQLFD